MSARQLKKLRGYNQTEDLKKTMGLESGDESEEEAPKLSKLQLLRAKTEHCI